MVYAIRHTPTGGAYFGVTRNFLNRESTHIFNLSAGHHHNSLLQRLWNEDGEDAFQFEIIEILDSEEEAIERELFWINHPDGSFNFLGKTEDGDVPLPMRAHISIKQLEPQARYNLLRLAHLYSNATRDKLIKISRRAHGDPRFFDMLLAEQRKKQRTNSKGSFTYRVYDKIVKWFLDNWPENADFPILDDLTQNERTEYAATQRLKKPSEGRNFPARQETRTSTEGQGYGTGASGLLAKLRRGL